MNTLAHLPTLPNYRLLEGLGESLQASVYKAALKDNPDRLFRVKLFKQPIKVERQIRYLRQRVERLKIIHDTRALVPIAFEVWGERQCIVQDWFPGAPLGTWQNEHGAEARLEELLTIACDLAQALAAVHDGGCIHGGVKPNNILIQPGTLEVRLVDFITSLDIREISHFIFDPGFIENTLAYTSPEQTARINHRVDFSSDLYSLGVVLYELLTGQRPFVSDDPLELIRSHLAEEPPQVHHLNPRLPGILGRIVAKLMIKEPEKRYQSGAGLYVDLMQCRIALGRGGEVPAFKLGLHDYTRRVIFISRMVGRDEEAQSVLTEYARVTAGGFRSVFISGLPGIGKTRLIQELQRPLVEHRGYFTSGKFDQYQKNIPYSSLIQALRNLTRTFLTESDERVAVWRETILRGVGALGKLIIDVVPELELLIGPQPTVPPLPPVEARRRFNDVFGRFVGDLAGRDNPLILFIDDLQWCDSATFDFLDHIFSNAEEYPYLFFIGAYRHNEVDPAHPLTALIRKAKQRRQPLEEIRVQALSKAACHEMVAYILDLPLEETTALAAFVAELTEGNPLFVSESLSWLHGEQLLVFGEDGQWGWDLEKITQANMPASVVELFGAKIRKLPEDTLAVLTFCACLGNLFDADDVALIEELPLFDLFERLRPALSFGLLIEKKSELQFVHDRVQEAVLRRLDTARRREIHWRIGLHLLGERPVDESLTRSEQLFTIAAHLNLGRPDGLDDAAALRLAAVNFWAGNKALDALATQAANEYFAAARKLLPPDAWKNDYSLSFRVHQKLAKTELMCGRYEKSEAWVNELIARAANDLDRAEALAEQTMSLSSIGDFIRAIETANRGLAYFDKAIPVDSLQARERMQSLMQRIHQEHDDVWRKILDMPFTNDCRSKIELAFYSELIPDLYMSGLVPQLYLSAAQSTLHCLQGGMDESVIYSFSIMGLNLGEQEDFERAFRYEDLAHQLCARHPDTFGATRGMNGIVWCNMHSRSHPAAIVEYCRKSIQCGKNCGDLYNAGLSYGPLMWNLQVQGDDFTVVEDAVRECREFSERNQLSFSEGLAQAMTAGWVEPMKNPEAHLLGDDTLALWGSRNHVSSAGSYFVHRALCAYYYGRHDEAERHLERVNDYLTGLTDNVLKRQWYVFRALNALQVEAERPATAIMRAETFMAPVRTWAKLGPLLKPFVALYDAEKARLQDDFAVARGLYLDAIDIARAQRYTFLEAFLHERLGELNLASRRAGAPVFLHEALHGYRRCKASGKEIQILERYGAQLEHEEDIHPGWLEAPPEETPSILDIDYLARSSLALSVETDLASLLHRIMKVMSEASGAQHGYLMMSGEAGWAVAAASHAGETRVAPMQAAPPPGEQDICTGLVNFVARSREKIIANDAAAMRELDHLRGAGELLKGSLMCLPLVKQSELVGVLYLENRLTVGLFTPDKVRMTELLAAQAAIALENARLVTGLREAKAVIDQLNAELEQRVEARTEALRAAYRELEAFSYSVSHDLRAPLRSIDGFCRVLLEGYREKLDATGQNYLDRVIAAAGRMGLLIDDLLKLSRVSRGPFQLRRVDLTAVARSISVTLSLLSPERRIEWIIPEGMETYADEGLLRIAMENLLQNAWKFTRKTPRARIEVGETQDGGHRIFCIRDNGVGFDMAHVDKLFKPFQRLHSTTEFEGTGIGLALVTRIVHRHNGKVWAEASPEEGARFCFYLDGAMADSQSVDQ